MINTININEARKQIDNLVKEGKKVIVVAKDDAFNRKILENAKVDVLVRVEKGDRKRSLRQIDSGLNHVLCKLAKENNIAIGIEFEELVKKEPKHFEKVLQNIRLCRKYKVNMVLINAKDKSVSDLRALLLTLGMTTSMAKYAVDNLRNDNISIIIDKKQSLEEFFGKGKGKIKDAQKEKNEARKFSIF